MRSSVRNSKGLRKVLAVSVWSLALAIPLIAQTLPWWKTFDFDGDKVKDLVDISYSGGGHCCYRLSIVLSSNGTTYHLPFEMDGGYVRGLDLSIPGHFDIKDFDRDGLPDIYMEIATYNNERDRIPADWQKKFRISTNFIYVSFKKGGLQVRDGPPQQGSYTGP